MTTVAPFPLVEIEGAPKARGMAYGEQARGRIGASVALYAGQLDRFGFGRDDVARFSEIFLPRLRQRAPDLVEEMEGIASGANLDLSSIVLVNARTEILQLARREKGISDDEPDGCTGAVILPEATRNGRLIHGQNWDWKAECAETSVVLRIRRTDGPDLLTFTEAGGLARSGFNAAGIGITANYLESDRDYREIGIPLPFIRRRALEAQHFADAIKVVATTPKSGSNNMILSTAEGFAVDFECAPDEAFAIYPDDDMIVHANHWQSPVALSKLRETGLRDVPDSLYRDQRVRRRLSARHGDVTIDDLKEALFDDFASPFSVCRPRIRKKGGNLSATVAMIVFEPAAGVMEIAPLPAENREFTRYELTLDDEVRERAEKAMLARGRPSISAQEKRWSALS
ncbi:MULTISPECIES: C45 family peptidase [unclassified Mesorhizobium]|uniref:C45 family autoproteolytic acyltransferase/hydolase n=1 Tax=unclassified Mesorhizobium TaxID=325217 RepID=UPI0003CFF576|nr:MULTISPECIES: C45 family peptidase [unclassified Mesorhizobium]ESZ21672.1 peptidase C45 [Mesorhizobium sp. L48C026A00]RWN57119.1 MAG: acyl-CoA--6-aminopenicillanic acid acyltransferase [Mesorhizobium sp.]RWN74319.1 MAG: acyl-CoA--6-aminopenicillanic acid acyltransferase [Mesorhizobium sp.]RWN82862.1 MAG: acyl-CoA--6-aminopenicillanic acid acyltransferase [Mesorhizobium sp.]RWN89334.1 MAG: acyl-CoA--6-aminopenicillanic acid acyltransferase [Mesorhizobium sp.]